MTTYNSIPDMMRDIGASEELIKYVEEKGYENALKTMVKMYNKVQQDLEYKKMGRKNDRLEINKLKAKIKDLESIIRYPDNERGCKACGRDWDVQR
jgi:hypothetical protein